MKKLFGAVVLSMGIAAAQEDAPGKGVARLSLISGDVSIKRGDTGEWVAAAVNGPLLAGDRLLSGTGSRAEVQFDWANMVRLSSDVEVRLSELEQDRFQIQLARGTIMFAVLRDSSSDVDISTPSVSVRPFKRGLYRVTVRESDTGPVTEISVRSGEADIYSPRGTQRLKSGRTMQVRGSVGDPEFQNVADLPDDDWDRWNNRRNQDILRSTSYNYVDRGVYGSEDLDGNGSWSNVAPYGWVWTPRVAAGWAPYRYGRWSWMDYYGWNWVSYDSWGWAPYHYGRWFYASNRWCWWPGARGVRSYWRPALVAWVGWGGAGWGVGVGVGRGIGYGWTNIGWLPLAPYEPFYPWYGRGYYGRGGYNRTTIVNNINITNIYRNARINDGVTVVTADRFGRGHVNNVAVDRSRLERAESARGALPMVPDRSSTRMSDREIRAGGIRESSREQFYSRREVPRSERMTFDEQRRNVEQIARNTFGEPPARSERPAVAGDRGAGERPVERSAERSAERGGDTRRIGEAGNGWRRIGDGGAADGRSASSVVGSPAGTPSSADRGGTRSATQSDGGWRRFGEPRRDGAAEAVVPRAERSSGSDGGGRQMGERSSENATRSGREYIGREEMPRDTGSRESGGSRSSGWQGFGSVPDAGSGRSERMNRGGGDSGSINVNPPVIRDRGSYGGGGSFGGGGRMEQAPRSERSSPRMEMPRGGSEGGGGFSRGSAPRMESAPRMSSPSMGGGGGGRSSDGGGGSRSSGGGGGSRSGGGGGRRN